MSGVPPISQGKNFDPANGGITSVYRFNSLGQLSYQTSTDDSGSALVKSQRQERIVPRGRIVMGSNPYRGTFAVMANAPQSTMGWVVEEYDRDGRLRRVSNSQGAARPGWTLPANWTGPSTLPAASGSTTYSYDGDVTSVQDAGSISRTTTADSLGRMLSAVVGSSAANYAYDVLDNLESVTQTDSVTQTRAFVYDSLSRLTSAFNPETGTIAYTYLANGLLQSRSDLRGADYVATLSYDAQNRLVSRQYGSSAITPNAVYCYDGKVYIGGSCTPPVSPDPAVVKGYGRLTGYGSTKSSARFTAFDAASQVLSSEQRTAAGTPYKFAYGYNPGGLLTSITYPSGRVVTYTATTANRVDKVSGASPQGATTDYLRNLTYAPPGGPSSGTQGPVNSPWTQSWSYNDHGQVTQAAVNRSGGPSWQVTLGYGLANNNGNLRSQTIETGVKTYAQTYSYDGTNRLSGFLDATTVPANPPEPARSQNFGYDNFGNQWTTTYAGIPGDAVGVIGAGKVNAANNRLSGASNHDAVGNLTDLPPYAGEYDADNRLTKLKLSGVTQIEQEYDAEGRRVRRVTPGGTIDYIYSAGGELMAEYGGTPATGGTLYLAADHLGSTRLVLDANGTCLNRSDFLPFGHELWRTDPCYLGNPAGAGPVTQRFTGQERDAETKLDFFGARYYSAGQGRFTSPDAPFADQSPADPLSWNLYSYVRNNPLVFVDPAGRTCRTMSDGSPYDDLDGKGCSIVDEQNKAPISNQASKTDPLIQGSNVTAKKDDNVMELYEFWKSGNLPNRIDYDAHDPMTMNMRDSAIVKMRIRQYVQAGCPANFVLDSGHFEAASETIENILIGPFNPTQMQVGGHYGSITRNGSLTVSYQITNALTDSSLFGVNLIADTFGVGRVGSRDNPNGATGPRHNVVQTFSWTGYNPCSK